ncbi:hypothetical protein [Leisingera sp. ANG-DT]|uniref:hypothetical protein n=1 Tax=Leisingera sp. ANG-DT TaxID=1577897 RepID=UPI000A9C1527|nr:hypothetical protein [Leisingera sp. ANG-DT]
MIEGKKEGGFSRKWAIVTVHPWLPSRSEQVARARAWGVDESILGGVDVSALFVDDVRHVKRTTNWPGKLVERGIFLKKMKLLQHVGHQVFFTNPLCVGFSEKHARSTVEGLFEAGLVVYVHSIKDNDPALYQKGDDMTEFYESVGLMANAKHQSVHRKLKSR